jgi:hypothetical protein
LSSEEARTGKRFPLELPIKFGNQQTTAGLSTHDISAAGVYIHSNVDLEIGANIEFEITLPGSVIGSDKDVGVHCQGRVVRMDPAGQGARGERAGVACVIDHYQFVRAK